ncbi:MAG: VWA domain-containing protein [Planctomycetota bacterium]|nr:VWA domain-containing protein [Planctomycetota bacterium]
MNDLLSDLLSMDRLRLGDEGVRFSMATELEAWVWALIVALAAFIGFWSYWRLEGPHLARLALAGLRAFALISLAFMICRPQLVRENERLERDWVVGLVDRSASLRIADVDAGAQQRQTREEQLRRTLDASAEWWAKLGSERELLWMGFDAGAYELARRGGADGAVPEGQGQLDRASAGPGASASDARSSVPGGALPELREPDGRSTDVNDALAQALRRVAARPVAGVVLFSDGRSNAPVDRALVRRLREELVPVYVVPLGSESPLGDYAVSRAEAPRAAFVGDVVPVRVRTSRSGGQAAPAKLVLIELVPSPIPGDPPAERVLDERELGSARGSADGQASSSANVTGSGTDTDTVLFAKPGETGRATWVVRIVPEQPDLSADNNEQRLTLDLIDRPIRVLYFDGYPRWEYRYLKNLLVRESSIRSSIMLLAPDRRFLQEGTETLLTVPRSPGEWGEFDVVVIGDMRPEMLSTEQLEQVKQLVAERGAGLLWIGGAGATPARWRGTPMGDLLPFVQSLGEDDVRPLRTWDRPVVMFRGPAAEQLGVLQLGGAGEPAWPEALTSPDAGWSVLYWMQRIDQNALKPTAETLAIARTADFDSAGPGSSDLDSADLSSAEQSPAILTMRYGSGRVIYVATDETWRWRHGLGEVLQERFWIPLIRLLARDSLSRSGRAARIEVAPDPVRLGEAARVRVQIVDQSVVVGEGGDVPVTIEPLDPESRAGPSQLRLTPEQQGATSFAATFTQLQPGRYRATAGGVLASADVSQEFLVVPPDDELRRPQTDHALLAELARETGGAVVEPAQLSSLVLPNRSNRVQGAPEIESLWDTPAALTLLMLLLTLEWIGRRLIKLS